MRPGKAAELFRVIIHCMGTVADVANTSNQSLVETDNAGLRASPTPSSVPSASLQSTCGHGALIEFAGDRADARVEVPSIGV